MDKIHQMLSTFKKLIEQLKWFWDYFKTFKPHFLI